MREPGARDKLIEGVFLVVKNLQHRTPLGDKLTGREPNRNYTKFVIFFESR